MQHFRQVVPAGSSPEEAAAALRANPKLAEEFDRIKADHAWRTKTRTRITNDYGLAVANAVLPVKKPGRPAKTDQGPWELMTGPARAKVAEALALASDADLSTDPAFWTVEAAKAAGDAIVAHYSPHAASTSMGLYRLRLALRAIGAAQAAVDATLHPDITTAANAANVARVHERVAAGIIVPPPYARIADLKERVEAFVRAPADAPVTLQDAADFLVVFSARPGEATTIDLGPRGGIVGSLKKRAAGSEALPIVTSVGVPLAEALLLAWKARPQTSRLRARQELPKLAKEWGLQARDLRAIGAALAVRAALLEGELTSGQARGVHRGAIRHAESKMGDAQLCYERVRDPASRTAAMLSELSPEDQEAIQALIQEKLQARARPLAEPQVAVAA